MDLREILFELNHSNIVIIPENDIEECNQLKIGYSRACLESVALIIDGHLPITDYKFNKEKLLLWCKENKIDVFHDEIERLYKFRNKLL